MARDSESEEMDNVRIPTSLRLTETAIWLLEAFSKETGLSRAGVVETALRRWAKDEGLWKTGDLGAFLRPPDEDKDRGRKS